MTSQKKAIKCRALMIKVDGLNRSFGTVHAVKNVSFTVAKGEVVGLLGPNGAGKSTTMRIITGYLQSDSGDVRIGGLSVATDSLKTRAMIGYLPESAPLYLDMEVTAFLDYIASIRGIESSEHRPRIAEMVKTCGLEDVVGRPIGKLSRGYRQRVGLASALIHRPKILVLDEPTSGLDPNQIAEIRSLIKKIGEERTVILSTHIMQEVEATCSRALIINKGELVGDGSLDELMLKKGGAYRYVVSLNASAKDIRSRSEALRNLNLAELTPLSDDGWQKAVFHGDGGDTAGEEIFKWVVANDWKLRELREEKTSLEDVFRTLTTGGRQ